MVISKKKDIEKDINTTRLRRVQYKSSLNPCANCRVLKCSLMSLSFNSKAHMYCLKASSALPSLSRRLQLKNIYELAFSGRSVKDEREGEGGEAKRVRRVRGTYKLKAWFLLAAQSHESPSSANEKNANKHETNHKEKQNV